MIFATLRSVSRLFGNRPPLAIGPENGTFNDFRSALTHAKSTINFMDFGDFPEILSERGAAHEQNYIEHLTKSGLEVADQPGPEIFAHASNC